MKERKREEREKGRFVHLHTLRQEYKVYHFKCTSFIGISLKNEEIFWDTLHRYASNCASNCSVDLTWTLQMVWEVQEALGPQNSE